MKDQILCGDALEILRTLPDESVHCCVTSPPYWGLRDYGVEGQIGLEPTPEEYVAKLVEVFREVRRVLRNDGTLWLNLGDTYNSAPGWGRGGGHKLDGGKPRFRPGAARADGKVSARSPRNRDGVHAPGLKPKDLVGVPWRVAFALQQPYECARIKDRIDRAWLAGLVDGEGCLTILRTTSPHGSGDSYPPVLQVRMCDLAPIAKCAEITGYGTASPRQEPPSQGGQRGSYQWRLTGQKAADIVAEIYPFLLVKRKQAIVLWNHQKIRASYKVKRGQHIPRSAVEKQKFCRDLIRPCILAGCPPGGIVLDPFFGAGTVGVVALEEGRHFIGIELNPEYCEMARERIKRVTPKLIVS